MSRLKQQLLDPRSPVATALMIKPHPSEGPHRQLCQEPAPPTSGTPPALGPQGSPARDTKSWHCPPVRKHYCQNSLVPNLPTDRLQPQDHYSSHRLLCQDPTQRTSRPAPAPRYLRLLTQPPQDPAPLTDPANQLLEASTPSGTSNQLDQGPAMTTRKLSMKLRTGSLKEK